MSDFCETNVRTYVRDASGRPGIWFLSLDAARLGAVITARTTYRLPYFWSAMRIGQREGWRTQLCGRGAPGQEPLFYVVELWLEDRQMAEIVPDEMMDAYRELIQIPVMNELFGYRKAA